MSKATLRAIWKPNGKHIDAAGERALKAWMHEHGFSTTPGAVTIFLHHRVHESARHHAASTLAKSARK